MGNPLSKVKPSRRQHRRTRHRLARANGRAESANPDARSGAVSGQQALGAMEVLPSAAGVYFRRGYPVDCVEYFLLGDGDG